MLFFHPLPSDVQSLVVNTSNTGGTMHNPIQNTGLYVSVLVFLVRCTFF